MNIPRTSFIHPALAALATIAALAAVSAQAQDATPSGPNAGFVKLDKNKDKFLSRAEASADAKLAKVFSKVDMNKDGKLDEDEYLKGVSLYQREQAGEYAGDSAVTTKVKAALLAADGVPSTQISVATSKGKVTLSGTVETKAQIAEAIKVTKAVGGVSSVVNQLKTK